jgi:AraC-like DNA-binding protein
VDQRIDEITVTKIESIMTVTTPKVRHFEINNRESYGLSFCIEGQITYTLDGEKYVSNRSCAILLPKGRSYTLHHDKNGIFPLINFQCDGKLCDRHVIIPIDNAEHFLKDYDMMRHLSLFEGNRMKIMSIFYGMLHRLVSRSSSGILSPAIKYIESNYSSPNLCNEDIAKQCYISEVYLRKLFLEKYGMTPRQFIIDIRINKAKQLLGEGKLKVSEVATQCGFSSSYHFCRTFKDHVGVTPSYYAQNNRISEM